MGSLKGLYFSLEDKYYAFLDAIQRKIPIYNVVDPVDKIIPSFAVILSVFFLLMLGIFSILLGGLFVGQENVSLSLTFNDADGNPVSGVDVLLMLPVDDVRDEVNGIVFPLTKETSSAGKVTFSVPPGNYIVQVADDAFELFTQDISFSESNSQIFSLQPKIVPMKTRTLLIQDASGTILGLSSPASISLSFSCQSGKAPLSQTVSNGNVTIQQSPSCIGLSVTVSSAGFITKTQVILGDTTAIQLQSSADLDDDDPPDANPDTGIVEVLVKKDGGQSLSGVQIKLYKVSSSGSNVLVKQSLSGASGFSLFEQVTPGKYVVIASIIGYKQITSSEFQVNAGETNTITLSLFKSSTQKKLWVKILNESNQLSILGAKVGLYIQSVSGVYLEDGTYTTDKNGVVDTPAGDFNSSYTVVVQHANFVTQFIPLSGIVSSDAAAPIPILLEPIQAKGSSGAIPNAVIADVKVLDEIGFPVLGATVELSTPDVNGITFVNKKTNSSGIARFENLPAGTYQAAASTSDADGTSAIVSGNTNQIIVLQVPLEIGSALVEVTVKTEQNQLVSDANVSVIKVSNGVVLAQGVTNAKGVASLGVETGHNVYVKVEKPSYLPFSSVPFEILKDNTHKITLEVSLTSASPVLGMSLVSIYHIASSGAQSYAQSLSPGETYSFHFAVKTPTSQSGLTSAVRLNGAVLEQLSTSIGSVLGGNAAKGGVSFYTKYNPSDEFSPQNAVNSGVPAKILLNAAGDVGAGGYEVVVLVKINSSAIPNTDKLFINFRAKSESETSPLYEESYTIGQPLPAQEDFVYLFFLTLQGSGEKKQMSPGTPAKMEANKSYVLEYLVVNVSGQDFPSATMNFVSSSTGTFSVVPSMASLPGFSNNKSVGGSVTIKSTVPCSSSSGYCATLTTTLQNVGTGKQPTTQSLQFYTYPEKELFIHASPSFLISGEEQAVQVVVKDNVGDIATQGTISSLLVVGQILDSSGIPVGNPFLFTQSSSGMFIGSVDALSNGQSLEITAAASGYITGVHIIPVTGDVAVTLATTFSCIGFSSESVTMQQGGVGSLTLTGTNCPEDVHLYTYGVSDGDGNPIVLATKFNGIGVTQSNPIIVPKNGSASITISSPSYVGMYPLYFKAKYASEANYVFIQNIDVLVNPLTGSNPCLSISKYGFDLTNGSDFAFINNTCNPGVHHSFYPSVSLPVGDAYTHAVSPLSTPEMKSPGSPLSFKWNVTLDYEPTAPVEDSSLSGIPLFSDYAHSPIVAHGTWKRYYVPATSEDGSKFKDKSGFVGASEIIIPDASSKSDQNYPVIENKDMVNDNPPHYNKGPKGLLFETTLITEEPLVLNRLCTNAFDINLKMIRVNGEKIGTTNGCFNNVYFHPGANAVQFYFFDSDNNNYWIEIYYRYKATGSLSDFKKLSDDQGIGFTISAEAGLPYVNDVVTNGPVSLFGDDVQGLVTPALHHSAPATIGALVGTAREILLNENGVDYLQKAYANYTSDNPSVRLFGVGSEVYAQYMGFDQPTLAQTLMIESVGLDGENYGVLTLKDYGLIPGTTPQVDVGILVDASASIVGDLFDEPDGATYPLTKEPKNGLCSLIENMTDDIAYFSNAQVNRQLFFLNVPPGMKTPSSSPTGKDVPCNSLSPKFVSNPVSIAGFDSLLDDVNESWANGVKQVVNDSFWTKPYRLLIIITDNKPYGTGPQANNDYWKGSQEVALVNEAISSMQSNGVKGIVLYNTPLESTSTGAYGNTSKNDAVEMMELFSSQTNGFVEALSYSEYVPTPNQPYGSSASVNNPADYYHAANNRVAQRIAQTIFDVQETKFVVKLTAHPANVCKSESNDIGFTGADTIPKIAFDWKWANVPHDLCQESSLGEGNYHFCDATQFTIALVKKLEKLKKAYSSIATPSEFAEIPSLETFDAYLMKDAFNTSFRNDFVSFFVNSSFADAFDYFKSDEGGVWKDYINPANDNLDFNITGVAGGTSTLPYSGLYRVVLSTEWGAGEGTFFVAGSPSAIVHVTLTPLADAQSVVDYSAFYDFPLDGLIGYDENNQNFHRNGYGSAFSGPLLDLVKTPSYPLRTYPPFAGTTPLHLWTLNAVPSFTQLNTANRGVVVDINPVSHSFDYRPSIPTPAVVEWSSNQAGVGDAFYGILESTPGTNPVPVNFPTTSSALAVWTPIASEQSEDTYGCVANNCSICLDAGSNEFTSSTLGDQNPAGSGVCSPKTPFTTTSSFGFTSSGGTQNKSYLSTVFYRVPTKSYSLNMACNTSPSKPTGTFLLPTIVVSNATSSLTGELVNASARETLFTAKSSLLGILDLIGSGDTCISTKDGATKLYWNHTKLKDDLKAQYFSYGSIAGNNCVATGNPLGTSDVLTLKEEAGSPITGSKPLVNLLCPLFSYYPLTGYYNEYGIPYPSGTQLQLVTGGYGAPVPSSWGDPLDPAVMYRYVPTQCTIVGGSTWASCGSAGSIPNYCAASNIRKWE
ncbi:MAG: carboxypeptidase-like regulatory domain-containing protein [Candidatus Diapherotrites archaeon]